MAIPYLHKLNYFLYLSIALLTFSCGSDKEKPLNVILIMTDDQGYGDMSCTGNPILDTPNLDSLYSESFRFTDFHVNSFCAPTRAALMTGRFSDRTHVRTTVYMRNFLKRDETTVAEYFKASGYKTAHFGKWHLGDSYPYRPMDRGFDEWVGLGDGGLGTSNDYWGNDRMNDHYLVNGEFRKIEGFGTDVFFDEAKEFIKKNKKKPFFIYLATNIPHGPMTVRKKWREKFDSMNLPGSSPWGDTADLFATLERLDYNIGELREMLKQYDLDENTAILFLTDNGTANGHHIYNAGMRGRKGSLFDGGHRVPLFVHIPGKTNSGRDIDDFTLHVDILPTLIELCDLQTPEKMLLPLDGESLVNLIENKREKWPQRTYIQHVQNIIETPVKGRNTLVATNRWRLINGKQLFDIKNDPAQKDNIAEKNSEIVEDLNNRYEDYWNSLNMMNQPYPRPIIGSKEREEIWLNPISWIRKEQGPHTWNQRHVREGARSKGFWPVEIASDENYYFEVRRWPKNLNLGMRSGAPAITGDISMLDTAFVWKEGKPLPIDSVSLSINGRVVRKKVKENAPSVDFIFHLKEGPADIKANMIYKDGSSSAAYYVYVRKDTQ